MRGKREEGRRNEKGGKSQTRKHLRLLFPTKTESPEDRPVRKETERSRGLRGAVAGQAPRAGVSGIFRDWVALLETGAGTGGWGLGINHQCLPSSVPTGAGAQGGR